MLFISCSKLFSLFRYLHIFVLTFWLCIEKRLDKKAKVKFKINDKRKILQQIITMHIVLNISRTKYNQTMKLGRLVGCNMRNIFLEKSLTKSSGETTPGPFHEKSKLSTFRDRQSEML